jgi:hypothetical protein
MGPRVQVDDLSIIILEDIVAQIMEGFPFALQPPMTGKVLLRLPGL